MSSELNDSWPTGDTLHITDLPGGGSVKVPIHGFVVYDRPDCSGGYAVFSRELRELRPDIFNEPHPGAGAGGDWLILAEKTGTWPGDGDDIEDGNQEDWIDPDDTSAVWDHVSKLNNDDDTPEFHRDLAQLVGEPPPSIVKKEDALDFPDVMKLDEFIRRVEENSGQGAKDILVNSVSEAVGRLTF